MAHYIKFPFGDGTFGVAFESDPKFSIGDMNWHFETEVEADRAIEMMNSAFEEGLAQALDKLRELQVEDLK